MVAEGPDPRVGSDLHLCAHLVAGVCAVCLVSGKTNPVASVWAARTDQGGVLQRRISRASSEDGGSLQEPHRMSCGISSHLVGQSIYEASYLITSNANSVTLAQHSSLFSPRTPHTPKSKVTAVSCVGGGTGKPEWEHQITDLSSTQWECVFLELTVP